MRRDQPSPSKLGKEGKLGTDVSRSGGMREHEFEGVHSGEAHFSLSNCRQAAGMRHGTQEAVGTGNNL